VHGQDASSPIRLFSPSHAVSPHLPSAICHRPTRLHTTSHVPPGAPRPPRNRNAPIEPMPCPCLPMLAHAQFARRAGDIEIRNWPQVLAYVMRCIIRESMVVCWLTRSLAFVALWPSMRLRAQMQHPAAVFTLRGALPSD
jgi:hypothetical protein